MIVCPYGCKTPQGEPLVMEEKGMRWDLVKKESRNAYVCKICRRLTFDV